MKIFANILIILSIGIACNHSGASKDLDDSVYLSNGDSIASIAQKVLMSNVVQAIETRGVTGAVAFCNERAIPLTDSVSESTGCIIWRLSNRNRNPANALITAEDSLAFQKAEILMKDSLADKKHFVAREHGAVYYYKAITIGMPACLKCHGSKSADISPETLQVIDEKSPADKATGYHMGEIRGLWKIKMNINEKAAL